MPAGELYINNIDAYSAWGISMEEGSLSKLLTPTGLKEMATNESRLENGVRVVPVEAREKDRTLTLEIHMLASSQADFFTKYNAFCEQLKKGAIDIKTAYSADIYHCYYQECSQFSQLRFGIAKFSLKLHEPDTTNRV